MGTNYYWHESGERDCPHCGQQTPALHVGKSSAGWCFSLRVHPEKGINTLDDWVETWASGAVFDEYGDRVDAAEMLRTITGRSSPKGLRRLSREPWGLDVRPGGPTWDLCHYEFS